MEGSSPQVKEMALSFSEFALNLYQELSAESSPENLFFSSYSIVVALSMTLAGARGNTSKQMLDTMNIGKAIEDNLHQTQEEYTSLIEKVQGGFVLNTANRLYLNKNFSILPDFLKVVSKMYHSSSENVDFGDSVKVTKEINDWVSQVTNGKIQDLIKDGVLTKMTALVLVNAIYFKGKWDEAFKPKLTRLQDFHKSADEKVQVEMMFMKRKLSMKDDASLGAKILEIPYLGKELSMYVILPHKMDGLKDVQTKLNAKLLDSMIRDEDFYSQEVEVSLPKFKVNSSFELNKVLSSLGIADLFDDTKCDLSGMGSGPLYVSKVLHKAFVEVNEEGTEAAAATAVAVNFRCMRISFKFNANHPFMFFIADKRSHMVLFIGKLADPSNK